MTQTMSIKDARDKFADIINQVSIAGDRFIVTKFGKPKAMIVPIETKVSASYTLDDLFGAWKHRTDINGSGKWVRKLRNNMSLRKKT